MSARKENSKRRSGNPKARNKGGSTTNQMLSGNEYGNEAYMGCVIFDDATFCEQIHDLLQHHHGRSMKEIGDLSLNYAL